MKEWLGMGFNLAWASLLAYWLWSARDAKASQRSEPVMTRLLAYWLPLAVAFVLLGPGAWFAGSPVSERFVPKSLWVVAAGLLLTTTGVALACWSRALLGRNWSSVVQLKYDHELIDHGPYSRIRHPIYTGLLLAFLGTALKVGDWRGLLAVAIVFLSFLRKLRLEEHWLQERFGDRYLAYRQKTHALLPGLF